jgi:hypothetical protein
MHMPRCTHFRLWFFAFLLATLSTLAPGPAHAQQPPSAAAQLADPHGMQVAPLPRVQLIDPGELELSERSMGGPGFEAGAGGVLMITTPIVAMMVIMATEPPWFECDDWFGASPESEQQQCQERHDRQAEQAFRKGIAVGLLQGSIGLGLLLHGAARIHRIRQARKHVELTAANFGLTPGGATFGVRASF